MRTPNTSCLLCGKPLYRRPYELAKTRYAACMACRSEAQKVAGITDAQQAALALPRKKGFNYLTGIPKSEAQKAKTSQKNREFWAANPEKAIERGAKTRGELNWRWKGGSSRLNTSIRTMIENRKWMDAVKARDGKCVNCGSTENLEAHHAPPLAELIDRFRIKSRDDARASASCLWDISNGKTLCQQCHYAEHNRTVTPQELRETKFRNCDECGQSFVVRPSRLAKREGNCCCRECSMAWRKSHPLTGQENPNWRGGLQSKPCQGCGKSIWDKTARIAKRKFCSVECCHANR